MKMCESDYKAIAGRYNYSYDKITAEINKLKAIIDEKFSSEDYMAIIEAEELVQIGNLKSALRYTPEGIILKRDEAHPHRLYISENTYEIKEELKAQGFNYFGDGKWVKAFGNIEELRDVVRKYGFEEHNFKADMMDYAQTDSQNAWY